MENFLHILGNLCLHWYWSRLFCWNTKSTSNYLFEGILFLLGTHLTLLSCQIALTDLSEQFFLFLSFLSFLHLDFFIQYFGVFLFLFSVLVRTWTGKFMKNIQNVFFLLQLKSFTSFLLLMTSDIFLITLFEHISNWILSVHFISWKDLHRMTGSYTTFRVLGFFLLSFWIDVSSMRCSMASLSFIGISKVSEEILEDLLFDVFEFETIIRKWGSLRWLWWMAVHIVHWLI